jgi:hypothetical protein
VEPTSSIFNHPQPPLCLPRRCRHRAAPQQRHSPRSQGAWEVWGTVLWRHASAACCETHVRHWRMHPDNPTHPQHITAGVGPALPRQQGRGHSRAADADGQGAAACGVLHVACICSVGACCRCCMQQIGHNSRDVHAPMLSPTNPRDTHPPHRHPQATGSMDVVTAEDVAAGEVDEVVQNLALRITEVRRGEGWGDLVRFQFEIVNSSSRSRSCGSETLNVHEIEPPTQPTRTRPSTPFPTASSRAPSRSTTAPFGTRRCARRRPRSCSSTGGCRTG